MKIIVVGGGIGGLTAALCLRASGHEVVVLEQAAEITEVGAGLQLSPNGTRILRQLGLLDAVAARAAEPDAIEVRMGESGHRVVYFPLDAAQVRWGAPYLHIHRADLIEVLADAVRRAAPHAIRTGVRVIGYDQYGTSAAVQTADGDTIEGDLVIGADGIHSIIRTRMIDPDRPRFTGTIAWRLTVPSDRLGTEKPPRSACIWAGAGRHAVTYHLRSGALVNLVGIVERREWHKESWTERGTRQEALADFAGWDPTITTLIREADTHHRWALFDREPLRRWSDGRVALLGDSCHPMLPTLAQGAVMAIEDARALTAALSGSDNVSAALKTYERARLRRTARVQAAARANLRAYHMKSTLGRTIAYAPMRLFCRYAPTFALSTLDWLFGYDAA